MPSTVGVHTTSGCSPTRWVSSPSGVSTPRVVNRVLHPPGSLMYRASPSAPTEGLPTTTAPGAYRRDMMANSAWLWLVSSMSSTTFPVYRGTGSVLSDSPCWAMAPAPLL